MKYFINIINVIVALFVISHLKSLEHSAKMSYAYKKELSIIVNNAPQLRDSIIKANQLDSIRFLLKQDNEIESNHSISFFVVLVYMVLIPFLTYMFNNKIK